MDTSTIETVQSFGFDVYMRDTADTYMFFTDGKNIGYLQYNRPEGFTLNTVHIPNADTGTGLSVARHLGGFTERELRECFLLNPIGYRFRSEPPKKWRNWLHFENSSKWNKSFHKVPTQSEK